MKILVVGGTGTVGSALVRELLARGQEVRVLTRSEKKGAALPAGATFALGDLNDIATVRPAAAGMDAMFFLNGLSMTEAHEGLIAVNAAMLEGIRRIVYMSVQDLESAPHLPHFGSKIGIEAAVRGSGIPWTILRPNSFFQNQRMYMPVVLEHGVYPEPIGTAGLSRIDVRDIAEIAATALTGAGHDGKTYDIAGARTWNAPETAEVWSKVLGRPIRYAGDDLDAWEAQAKTALPAWLAFDLRCMYEHFQQDGLEASQKTVAEVTRLLGHPPREFEAYVREIAP
ncbi:MAG TPA: NmrA family NAD(P)-binding protein [Candidatus Polarisedimenticolaceae bacterium]|nr:NmrA family NAD(P)-binding protein [Candidatus Polarisedimenticolaceae bacterium]